MAKIDYDADPLSGHQHLDEIVGIVEDGSLTTEEGVEYTISTNEEGMVYRVVQVGEEQKVELTTGSGSAVLPPNCQYIVFDNANGYLQAVQAPTNVLTSSGSSNSAHSMVRPRPSVAIAPKIANDDGPSPAVTVSPKATTSPTTPPTIFKKRDDRRRATHNEVERRRRDKINHWIMKLGSIIPADGSSQEIGDSGRVSVAAVEGQSKGGILSKACEYVQMLQEHQNSASDECLTSYDRKRYEDEIVHLRQENEILKTILIKNGIQYMSDLKMHDKS